VQPPQYQFTLIKLTGLIVACAATLALLGTPVAPLVQGIMIVLPGFLIDRARGGPGIVGGTISSAIFAVTLGIAFVYSSGDGTFTNFLAGLPAVYLVFVLSLMWGSVVSMTLYWFIKTYRERRRKSPAMQPSRIQFTLGQLMGLILICALVFAALSTPFAIFVLAIGIVVPGFLYDRFRGGAGIVGGMVSAALVLVALGIAAYTYCYFNPDPALLAYLGPPILTLLMLGVAGAVWGAMAGTLIDVIIVTKDSYKKENPMIDESSALIVWLPDETKE
jgi:hypothetical protein